MNDGNPNCISLYIRFDSISTISSPKARRRLKKNHVTGTKTDPLRRRGRCARGYGFQFQSARQVTCRDHRTHFTVFTDIEGIFKLFRLGRNDTKLVQFQIFSWERELACREDLDEKSTLRGSLMEYTYLCFQNCAHMALQR